MLTVTLKPKKEESLLRFHPWVFSGAIQTINGKPEEGDPVKVVSAQNTFLGIGHFQIGSIAVRLISFQQEPIDESFWARKIGCAYQLRKDTGLVLPPHNNIYRLIHGEGDGLPGLIVDVYDDTAVMQAHSVGMHRVAPLLAEIIVRTVPAVENVYYKSETTLPYYAPVEKDDKYLIGGLSDTFCARENGLRFEVDWLRGQKTGFFIDQRENRSLLEKYARGRRVLNMFCYTGGFSVYALRGGAALVHSVDSSAKAVELTERNVAANFPAGADHCAYAEDAFKFLSASSGAYDLVVLDPPAFAKHREALRNALKGYMRLNQKALRTMPPNSLLFTFSCSQVVSREQFRLAVFSAAAEAGRTVRILHQLTQPADHPINIYHPEGEYLKGLVVHVE